jgi:hypothetical protein
MLEMAEESVAGFRAGQKRKRKHNTPAETVPVEITNSQAALSRCQSPSDLLNRENVVEEENLDPFGLNTEAGRWLKAEQQYYKSRVDTTYFPATAQNEVESKLRDAPMEYARRRLHETMAKNANASPVLLISTNVSKEWVPPESVGKGFRFLVFPQVDGSPLFLTYMPGRAHGAAGAFVSDSIGRWKSNEVLGAVLSGGLSSGNYGTFQPDIRIYPNARHKDKKGPDKDRKNGCMPCSRLIWEIEHGNKDPAALRQRGKRYMNCKYTRLFLACKIFEASRTMLRAEIVLWGKVDPETQVVSVLAAVSFGTVDLTDDEKGLFEEARHDRLVGGTNWTRPARTELGPFQEGTPDDWKMNIPYQGILFKMTTKRSGQRAYLMDELTAVDGVDDLVLDLQELARRICEPDDMSESESEATD